MTYVGDGFGQGPTWDFHFKTNKDIAFFGSLLCTNPPRPPQPHLTCPGWRTGDGKVGEKAGARVRFAAAFGVGRFLLDHANLPKATGPSWDRQIVQDFTGLSETS